MDIKIHDFQSMGIVIIEDDSKSIAFNQVSMGVWVLDQPTRNAIFELDKNYKIKETLDNSLIENVEKITKSDDNPTKNQSDLLGIFASPLKLKFNDIQSASVVKQDILKLCEYAQDNQETDITVLFNYKKIDKKIIQTIREVYTLVDDLSFEFNINITPAIYLPYNLIRQIPQFENILKSFEYVIIEIGDNTENIDVLNSINLEKIIVKLVFEEQDKLMDMIINLSEIDINKFQIPEYTALNLYDKLMPYLIGVYKTIYIDQYMSIILPLLFKRSIKINPYGLNIGDEVVEVMSEELSDNDNYKNVRITCEKCWARNLCLKKGILLCDSDNLTNKNCRNKHKLTAKIIMDYKQIVDNLKNRIKNSGSFEHIKMLKEAHATYMYS
ncbi:MAG: hypothetical protein CVU88_04635 [Firmicutes bacterium HGW-Firmicutes-13]|nr:MAG: hypothetical protein CVU88_04635 [Firmicutes bacterium HGW-Firmicutes-13]